MLTSKFREKKTQQKLIEKQVIQAEDKISKSSLNNDDENDTDSELDSDDEFLPLNIDDDEEEEIIVNGVKPPVYLRDCIAGLLSKEDPDRLEACLKVIEKLVLKQTGELDDVCVELTKILLHLENQYDLDDFYRLKMQAMISITVKCPKQISVYLTEQFYKENYTINQRLDILEVISHSVTTLSKPIIDNPEKHRSHLPLPNIPGLTDEKKSQKPEWQKIVDERIEKKTRRFKGESKMINAVENQLNDVAGLFFFPLIKSFGMQLNTCDLFGSDNIVLGRLVYTLGVILHNSDGLPIACMMGKTLLDLIWSLRYHKESFVRQSLLYSLSMIVLHVPNYLLITELQVEIFEARDWLTDVIDKDPNTECKKLAASCLALMEKTLKEGLGVS